MTGVVEPGDGHAPGATRGCLRAAGIALAIVGVLLLLALGVALYAYRSLMSVGDLAGAIDKASSTPAVVAALGAPVEAGWVPDKLSIPNLPARMGDRAEFDMPLSGSRARGVLHVVARNVAGGWRHETLCVTVAGSDRRIEVAQEDAAGTKAVPAATAR